VGYLKKRHLPYQIKRTTVSTGGSFGVHDGV